MTRPVTRDQDQVLAEFVRNRSITLGGTVDHDCGDSTIVIENVDLDLLFKDIQALGWHVVVQVSVVPTSGSAAAKKT